MSPVQELTVQLKLDGSTSGKDQHLLSARKILAADLDDPIYDGSLSRLKTFETADLAIAQVCAKIKALATLLDSLREHQAAVLATPLPAEILLQIFVECIANWNAERSGIKTSHVEGHRKKNWLNFSQVCTRWRQVALSCAWLWAAPDFSRPSIAKTMVERTGLRFLQTIVCVDKDAESAEFATFFELRDKCRIKLLHVHYAADSRDITSDIAIVLSEDHPCLSSIVLDALTRQRSRYLELGNMRAPQLDTILLKNVFIQGPWISFSANLTSLELQSDAPSQGTDPLCFAILEILAVMPKLERLHLLRVMTNRMYPAPEPLSTKRIVMRNLKSIKLEEGILEIDSLIRHVDMPVLQIAIVVAQSPGGFAVLSLQILRQKLDVLCGISRYLAQSLPRSSSVDSTLQIFVDRAGMAVLKFNDYCRLAIQTNLIPPSDITSDDGTNSYARQFISSFPLENISGVNCWVLLDVVKGYWQIFAGLPNLSTIRFGYMDAFQGEYGPAVPQELLRALTSSAAAFPALQELELSNMTMSRLSRLPNGAHHVESMLPILLRYINQRATAQVPLSSVVLYSCEFVEQSLADLPDPICVIFPRISTVPWFKVIFPPVHT